MKKENHQCTLGLGSDSMLPRVGNSAWSRLCRRICKLAQVSQHHPQTYDYFYSYPAVMAERQRHLYEAATIIIHPFSLFSLFWNSMMIVVDLAHMFISTFRLCYVIHQVNEMKTQVIDYILLGLYMICILDIIIHFNTGYVEKKDQNERELVLDRERIICRYFRRWFLIDLLSCIPMAYALLKFAPNRTRYILIAQLMPILRILKICIVAKNMKVFIKIFTRSYIIVGLVHHTSIFLLSVHVCSCIIYLPPVFSLYCSDSMLPRVGNSAWSRLCRRICKLAQVSQHHPQTYDYFYSYPAVMAERQRHLYEAATIIIHPFSLFSLFWNSMMIVVDLAHMFISTFRLCYVIHQVNEMKTQVIDYILLGLYMICILDIIIHFNTGYVEKKDQNERELVLDRERIICRYFRRWFLIDLLSCIPMAYALLKFAPNRTRYILIAQLMPILRILKICIVAKNMKVFIKIFTRSYIIVGLVHHTSIFLLSVHVCSCIIYLPPVFSLYWNGFISPKHSSFLNHTNGILEFSINHRYEKAVFISLSGFFATGFSMFPSTESDETLLHALVILYSALFIVYNFVFLLKIYMTIYSSTMRYNELMNQVEEYMKIKQFPTKLKKRVRSFYRYRYQQQYFSEDSVFGSLSDELRNEISLHTCYKLVNKVAIFKDLPAKVVGSVLGCLHPEVYLPNDSVLHAGDIGDCMYFIANGTVAVYSLKGVEVCHLEDGAHFGEVALLMKDSKRVATVVAVETTELYRLNVSDFKQFILTNEILYQRIEALASKRMHETVVLDEQFRKEWERTHSTDTVSS